MNFIGSEYWRILSFTKKRSFGLQKEALTSSLVGPEKKPERILISTVDRTEFFYLSGRASVHLQSSSLSSGPRPGVVRTEREKWERPEENNLCFVPCSHKKLFYWDPFPLHINILNQAKLFTRKMKTKDSFTRQKTRFRGFLGNSPKQLKLSFG